MNKSTANLVSLATKAFADHQFVRCEEDRWFIARAERGRIVDGAYATEIISLWHGRLFVGGDIDDCVFAYYTDSDKPIDKLRWIGRSDDLEWYVLQKAQIGLSDGGKLTRGRGKGPSARVVYAWAAVRKLCDLLDTASGHASTIKNKQSDMPKFVAKHPDGSDLRASCDCCDRVGEYNGFGSGSLLFVCPKHCPCHD